MPIMDNTKRRLFLKNNRQCTVKLLCPESGIIGFANCRTNIKILTSYENGESSFNQDLIHMKDNFEQFEILKSFIISLKYSFIKTNQLASNHWKKLFSNWILLYGEESSGKKSFIENFCQYLSMEVISLFFSYYSTSKYHHRS